MDSTKPNTKHRDTNMETTNTRPPPPKVTSSMLAAAGQTNDNGTTSSMKTSLVNEDLDDDDDALIPEIEEIQSGSYELPTTPTITKEMFDIMYPPLPTMQELVRILCSILPLNIIHSHR